jgi:hypothetical protein
MRPVTRFVLSVDAIFAIQPRMDIPRNRQAERVRRILSTRGLTFYRASQRSVEMFGRSSPFYLPHNLHYDLAVSAATPSLYQLIALSRITRYRLSDWLAVFGFDLDAIPQLQVLVSRRRTVILDSAVYDTEAWLPWFIERSGAGPGRYDSFMTAPLSRSA